MLFLLLLKKKTERKLDQDQMKNEEESERKRIVPTSFLGVDRHLYLTIRHAFCERER